MFKNIISFFIIGGLLTSGLIGLSGCESAGKKTAYGAAAGAAAGGLLGAVVSKDKKKGLLIGAALGATAGGLIGNRLDKQQKELEKIAETKRTEQGLITKLKSDILFDTGKSDLKSEAKQNIGKMASIMKKYPENVLNIKGYTDSTGSEKINREISEKRAEAVKYQLVMGGVPADTIQVHGMGPANPISENKSEAGRKQNRRVEIEITVDESKVPKS